MRDSPSRARLSRRDLLQSAAALGIAAAAGRAADAFAAQAENLLPPIIRTIPSTGEKVPAVGIGTNAYDVSAAEDIAARKQVLEAMPSFGAKVIDRARGYFKSEAVIGQLLAELGTRDQFFLCTKPLSAPQADATITEALIDESFRSLRTTRIDLLQVHSFVRIDELIPRYREYKQAGRIRYIGITTAVPGQHAQLVEAMRRHKPDFIQVDYSIDDRAAATDVFPVAQEMGIAVLNNVPFGGSRGSLFPKLAGKKLPEWAGEIDVATWAQFMLKYNLSHPAVTAAIPGTTTLAYLRDNQRGGRGVVPNAAQRKRMEAYWDALI